MSKYRQTDSVRIDENGKKRMKGYETLATNFISLGDLNPFDLNISKAEWWYQCWEHNNESQVA